MNISPSNKNITWQACIIGPKSNQSEEVGDAAEDFLEEMGRMRKGGAERPTFHADKSGRKEHNVLEWSQYMRVPEEKVVETLKF